MNNREAIISRLKSFNHFYKLNGGQIGMDYIEDVDALLAALSPQPVEVDILYQIARTAACPQSDPDCTVCDFSHGADKAVDAFLERGLLRGVPEITEAMRDAGGHIVNEAIEHNGGDPSEIPSDWAEDIFKAMITAAKEEG